MTFPGPLSISPLQTPTSPDLGLRPFQRVTAQVLTVTATTAILAIEGYPVVVQLTSADQAAALLSQRTAQFIVTKLTDQVVTLKFVRNDQPQASLAGTISNGPELAVRLLEQNNIPATINNLMMARSVLKQQLPVTPGLLNELLGALSDYGVWGSAEAELVAAMKAAGLPVTAQSLALASRQAAQTGEALGQLIASLQTAGQNLPADLLKQIHENLQMLNALVLSWDESPSQLAEQLRAAIKMLGNSLESVLLEQSQNSETLSPEKSLVSLVRLQQVLEQAGKKELSQAIDKFLGDLRQQQFMNIKPNPTPGHEEWSEIGLMIQSAQQKADDEFSSARLRIAHESKSDPGEMNPAYTRLILQVDLDTGKTVEVDLSLTGKQIRTMVTAPDPLWCQQAQNELPSLEQALQELGFSLKETQIGVGNPRSFGGIPSASGNPTLMTVDIEA